MLALCGGAVVWRTYCCCKEGRLWLESFRGSLVFLSVPGWSPGQLCQEPQIRARYHHQQHKSLRSQKVVNYWKCLALKSTPQVSSLIEMSTKQNSTSGGKKWKFILVRKQIINIFYRTEDILNGKARKSCQTDSLLWKEQISPDMLTKLPSSPMMLFFTREGETLELFSPLSARVSPKGTNKYLCGNVRNYCFVPNTSNSGQTILKGPFQTGQPVDFSFSMLYAKSKLKKMFPIPLRCVSYTKPAKNKVPNNTQA